MPTTTLPEWITDNQAEKGPGHFTTDCDVRFPEIIADLKARGHEVPDPLDQYWCNIVSFIARKDAHMALVQSGASKKADGKTPAHRIVKQTADQKLYGNHADPSGSGKLGWVEYTEVDYTPDKPVKKGETIDVGGVKYVCIDDFGAREERGGGINSAKFRKEEFHERPEGKGVAQAVKDAPLMFEQVRGYPAG